LVRPGSRPASRESGGDHEREVAPAEAPRNVAWDLNKVPLFPRARIQAKLTVGNVDDPLEREADRVADQAMRQTEVAAPISLLSAASQSEESSADVFGTVEEGLSGGSQPLAASVRADMEPKFGFDFSKIRIHANPSASRSAEQLSAKAYAIGPDIVFGSGAYAPGSADGNWLLAHELTHVAQQSAATKFAQIPSAQPASPTAGAALAGGEAAETAAGMATPLRQEAGSPSSSNNSRTRNGFAPAAAPRPNTNRSDRIVRRQLLATPAANMTPDYSQMTWQQLLPHAHGAKGAGIAKIDLHTKENRIDTRGTGEAPTLNYAKDVRTDPASAAPQGGVGGTPEADAQMAAQDADLSAAQDTVISQIKTARGKIPSRPMARSLNNNAGYDYNPDKDPVAKDYNQWVKSALPTGVNDSDWNWQVFKRIQGLEGQEGRFTTFDKTLSVGPGFSTSGGQTQRVIGRTFNLLPGVKSIAFAAGLVVDTGGAMMVVDTASRWILESQDAATYLQTELSLLSLLVNVSQGTQPVNDSGAVAPDEQGKQRQALLDSEWQQFLSVTLAGITGLVKSWPLDSAILAVHAKHAQPGNFPFTFWSGQNGPGLSTMVAAIYDRVGDSAKFICTGKYAQYHGKSG